MFVKTDVVSTEPLLDFSNRTPMVCGGIREEYCRVVTVKAGVLPPVPYMHPTRVFHKGTDRAKEFGVMRVVGLIAPDIAVPMTKDRKSGVYMRWVSGRPVRARKTYTAQHRFDFGCIAVLDALIGNQDRHSNNAMVTKGHVYPIDHGSTLAYGMLSKHLSVMQDFDRMATKDKDTYSGIVATLARVKQYAEDIADIINAVKYTGSADDIKAWATVVAKEAARDYKRKAPKRW